MDPYFKSIGFGNIDKKKMNKLINDIKINPDNKNIFGLNNDVFVEYYKMYTDNIGLIIRGILDESEKIKVTDYQPYIISDIRREIDNYFIDNIDGEYVVVFIDSISGKKLTFKLQNTIGYIRDSKFFDNYKFDGNVKKIENDDIKKVNIAGLSLKGTIILPILKDDKENKLQNIEKNYYKELEFKFNKEDVKVGELLNIYADNTSELIKKRLRQEDFLSVIESYFLPIEDDGLEYSVLGNIKKIDTIENVITNEKIYKLIVDVIGIETQIYINMEDILGIPREGMRFMGNCKLYGKLTIR